MTSLNAAALVNSISTRIDFWLENLKALQKFYTKLTALNTVYKDWITKLTEQLQINLVTYTSSTRLSPKHPDPEKFSGDQAKFEAWII